jgi:predicted nuclease of predicted toxin-antitoxin system
MRLKIDENLPVELAELLADARHEAVTVFAQHLQGQNGSRIAQVCGREGRVLITLDLDFADMRAYPPQHYPDFIVLRVGTQDKPHILHVFERAIALIGAEPLEHRLWIVEETRVRIRGEVE